MRGFLVGSVILAASLASAGQGPQIEASVDRTSLPVGQILMLTITVYGGDTIGEPDVNQVEGFDVIGVSTSRSISFVNMRMSKSISFQYRLLARAEGKHQLGPFRVKVDDVVLETEPIEVVVSTGSGSPATRSRSLPRTGSEGDDVLLLASVDRQQAYVGQQVTYTLKFAYRIRLVGDTEYIPPEHKGFWSEDLGQQGPDIEVIDGKRYYVVTKRIALFPISSGRLSIGEAAVRYVVEGGFSSEDPFVIFRRDPFDMFHGREGIVRSKPIELDVLPLPQDAPAGFSGAVGRFELSVRPSATEVKVGESITLSVKIDGEGSLQSVGEIPLPQPEGFKVFAPKAREAERVEGTKVYATKTYDLVLVPQHTGNYEIGGFAFSYFDPYRAKYVTAKAEPINIKVLPGEAPESGARPGGLIVARKDIRHIRPSMDDPDELHLNLSGRTSMVVQLLPFVIVVVGIVIGIVHRHTVRTGRAAAGRAFRDSMKELRRALDMVKSDARATEAAAMAAQALRSYIARRLGRKVASIQVSTLETLAQVDTQTRDELVNLLNDLDRIRFAPVGKDIEQMVKLVDRAMILLRKVDHQW